MLTNQAQSVTGLEASSNPRWVSRLVRPGRWQVQEPGGRRGIRQVIKVRAETRVKNRAGTVSPGQITQFPSQRDSNQDTNPRARQVVGSASRSESLAEPKAGQAWRLLKKETIVLPEAATGLIPEAFECFLRQGCVLRGPAWVWCLAGTKGKYL